MTAARDECGLWQAHAFGRIYYHTRQLMCKRMPQGYGWHEGKSEEDWSRHDKDDRTWHGGGHKEQWYGMASGGSSSSKHMPYMKKEAKPVGGSSGGAVHRGGWFAKCQSLCTAVMAHNWGTARELADEFYAGPDVF